MTQKEPIDAALWARLRSYFEHAHALGPAERKQFLDELGAAEPALRVELESLLAASDKPVPMLEEALLPRLTMGKLKPLDENFSPPEIVRPATSMAPAVPPPVPTSQKEAPPPKEEPPKPSAPSLSSKELGGKSFKPRWAGRYLLLRRLGRGGMAEVFLARTQGPGGFERLVAVKRIVADFFGEEELRTRFEGEARLSALLTHPNIVHVYDFCEVDGIYLLAMEYVKGKDLAALVDSLHAEGSRLPVMAALYVACEVAKGLDYAYHRTDDRTGKPLHTVHRDISPRNIMIAYDGSVKIVDFGIARTTNRTQLTAAGTVRGTIAYLAPEVASGERPDHRSDIFSLSTVLYELLAARLLFEGEHIATVIDEICRCTIPGERIPELPVDEDLKTFLAKGLERNPADRYQSAADFVTALQNYLRVHAYGSPKQELVQAIGVRFERDKQDEERATVQALKVAEKIPAPSAERVRPAPVPAAVAPRGKEKVHLEKPRAVTGGIRPVEHTSWAPETSRSRSRLVGATVGVAILCVTFLVVQGRNPQPATESVAERAPSQVIPRDNCKLTVVTSPPGAQVLVGGREGGVSPTTLPVPCGVKVEVSIEAAGYERDKTTILGGEEVALRRELKAAAPGKLELVLTRDAKVLLDDAVLAEVSAGQAFELTLRAGQIYTLRFVNEKLGITTSRRFTIAPGQRVKNTVVLEPGDR